MIKYLYLKDTMKILFLMSCFSILCLCHMFLKSVLKPIVLKKAKTLQEIPVWYKMFFKNDTDLPCSIEKTDFVDMWGNKYEKVLYKKGNWQLRKIK